MNYLLLHNLKYFNLIFLIILAYMFQRSLEDMQPYIIYQTHNTYPRPLLLENGDMMVFSGDPAMMSRYNSNAEVIYSGRYINKTNNFNYDKNACIRQFSNDPNDATKIRFVLASGTEKPLTIHLFTENDGIVATSTFSNTKVISYKIDIYVLSDYTLLISFVGNYNGQKVHVKKYNYDEVKKEFNEEKNFDIEKDTYNLYISCTQIQNGKIVCQYVHNDCEEKGFNFDVSGANIKDFNIELKSDNDDGNITECGFDKVIHLRNNYVVFTYMNDYLVKFKICEVSSDGMVNYIKDNIGNEILNEKCVVNANEIDVAKFNENTFVISCIGEDKFIYIDYETFNSRNQLNSKLISTSYSEEVHYPFVSKFSEEFLSIFYKLNNDNVFEIIGYPICKNYNTQTIYINANTNTFTLTNNIGTGTGEETGITLELYFPENVPYGKLYLVNNDETRTLIEAESSVPQNSEFLYQSDYYFGEFSIKFAGKRGDKIGAYCSITFHVTDCYEGCKTCRTVGTAENMLCYGCNKPGGYYTDEEYDTIEREQSGTINCYNEISHEGYYLEGEVFKRCWTTCKYCSGTGNEDTHLCKECINDFIPLINDDYEENDPFNCVAKNTNPDGYYSNGTHYLQCYISCKTCSAHGDETQNNCILCDISNGYYSFEDQNVNTSLKGQCSNTDYPGYHYLYIPEEGSTDESMWKVCYTTTCATCTQGGTESENNCETCKIGYYKIEDDTKGTCTNENPEHYYFDNEAQIYKKCYEACHNCTDAKKSTSMNCAINDDCFNSNYHKLIDNDTECHNDSTVPDHYYYDDSIHKYNKCNDACTKCTTSSDDIDNTLCLSKKCSDGYAYLYNIPTQCYDIETTNIDYYYLTTDEIGNKYYAACAEGCLTCDGNQRSDCTSCDNRNNYYQKYSNKNDGKFYCFYHPSDDETDQTKIDSDEAKSYYISTETVTKEDGTTSEITYLYECYSTCDTCREDGTDTDHNCITCINENYFIEGTENCAHDPDGYYLYEVEGSEPIYKHCYDTCKKCTELGEEDHHKCTECKSQYLSYTDETYTDFYNCKEACPDGKYYNNNNECDTCIEDYEYIKYNLFCINCKDTNQYHKLGEETCLTEDEIPNNLMIIMEQLKNVMMYVILVLNVQKIVE